MLNRGTGIRLPSLVAVFLCPASAGRDVWQGEENLTQKRDFQAFKTAGTGTYTAPEPSTASLHPAGPLAVVT